MSDYENDDFLEKEFDFSKAVKNPYIKELKKQITIKISPATVDYFKNESLKMGIPYQTLINLYLDDCVQKKKKLEMVWNNTIKA